MLEEVAEMLHASSVVGCLFHIQVPHRAMAPDRQLILPLLS